MSLKSIPDLKSCTSLETLDLSFNNIREITCYHCLPRLKNLIILKNAINSISSQSSCDMPNLVSLDFRYNPFCLLNEYRQNILVLFKNLKILDGRNIDDTNYPVLFRKLIPTRSSEQMTILRHLKLRTIERCGSSAENYSLDNFPIDTTFHIEMITTLELESCNLKSLENLPQMPMLKWISLRNNAIIDIRKLSSYPKLVEISLENNLVLQFASLQTLIYLKKLNLRKNSIQKIEPMPNFASLSMLCIDSNRINSSKNLATISTLLELCMI